VCGWAPPGTRHPVGNERFRERDRVEWNGHGETVPGTVSGEITADTEAAGRTVHKTGAKAVHEPGALTRRADRLRERPKATAQDSKDDTWTQFHDTVNMAASEIDEESTGPRQRRPHRRHPAVRAR